MKVADYINNQIKKGPVHFSLLDPDKSKMGLKKLKETVEDIDSYGTDLILVGGSTNVDVDFLDGFVRTIKDRTDKPAVLFPGGLNGITRYADAILFMSLMNSTDPFWLVGAQSKAAPLIKKIDLETIPMGYLVVEPGMAVGKVGKADVIRRSEPEKAVEYALASQYFGMKLVYLEAGSGAPQPVPAEMISAVKKSISIPLIAGGGIRTPEAARAAVGAGADIIVTGTQIEDNTAKLKAIIKAIKN